MAKINSVVIIDFSEIDNFINQKTLEYCGAKNIRTFKRADEALRFLEETDLGFQLIIVGNNIPVLNGFDFIAKFNTLGLHTKHGKVILLSAFFSPDEIEEAQSKKIEILNKPLNMETLMSV
jgi:response regulator RpfG family c-di-GMP phosphodiesterase